MSTLTILNFDKEYRLTEFERPSVSFRRLVDAGRRHSNVAPTLVDGECNICGPNDYLSQISKMHVTEHGDSITCVTIVLEDRVILTGVKLHKGDQ